MSIWRRPKLSAQASVFLGMQRTNEHGRDSHRNERETGQKFSEDKL
jgi:hypothetical protein